MINVFYAPKTSAARWYHVFHMCVALCNATDSCQSSQLQPHEAAAQDDQDVCLELLQQLWDSKANRWLLICLSFVLIHTKKSEYNTLLCSVKANKIYLSVFINPTKFGNKWLHKENHTYLVLHLTFKKLLLGGLLIHFLMFLVFVFESWINFFSSLSPCSLFKASCPFCSCCVQVQVRNIS